MKKSTSIIIFILCLSFLFVGAMKSISTNMDNDPTPTITVPAEDSLDND